MPTYSTPSLRRSWHIVALASLLGLCPLAHAVEDCELNGASVNPSNGYTTQGKTGMMRCRDRDSGQVVREQELRSGAFVGLVRYFKNGVLSREFSVNTQGNQHGLLREWAPNGQLVLETNKLNSKTQGLLREWHANGALRRVEFFGDEPGDRAAVQYHANQQLSDLRCGNKPLLAPHADDAALCGFRGTPSTVSIFGANGGLRATMTLLAGVSQQSTSFHSNGKPSAQEEVRGEQRVQRVFSENGAKLKETFWSMAEKPATLLRETEFHASGTLVRERLYAMAEVAGRRRNRLVAESRFYLNGQPQSKDEFTLDGEYEIRDAKSYFDNGQLSRQGRYVQEGRSHERPTGVHRVYSQAGQPVQEIHHDERGKPNRERRWDNTGKLVSDDALFEDGSRKAFAK